MSNTCTSYGGDNSNSSKGIAVVTPAAAAKGAMPKRQCYKLQLTILKQTLLGGCQPECR